MEITSATWAAPGVPNEDFVAAGDGFALVIDGATPEPDTDSGCVHGVRWLVAELGTRLFTHLARDERARTTLPDLLRAALEEVAQAHGGQCDLTNPRSPSATLAIAREYGTDLQYLVLGDSAIVLSAADREVEAVVDDRMDAFADRSWADLRHLRNVEGGFWVAGNTPQAAAHALTGTRPTSQVRRAALMTDGAYRLVTRYGWSWRGLFDLLDKAGPEGVLGENRSAESGTEPGTLPGKRHDDSTIALCDLTAGPSAGTATPAPAGVAR